MLLFTQRYIEAFEEIHSLSQRQSKESKSSWPRIVMLALTAFTIRFTSCNWKSVTCWFACFTSCSWSCRAVCFVNFQHRGNCSWPGWCPRRPCTGGGWEFERCTGLWVSAPGTPNKPAGNNYRKRVSPTQNIPDLQCLLCELTGHIVTLNIAQCFCPNPLCWVAKSNKIWWTNWTSMTCAGMVKTELTASTMLRQPWLASELKLSKWAETCVTCNFAKQCCLQAQIAMFTGYYTYTLPHMLDDNDKTLHTL